MNPDLRVLVENALETFEGGRFQEFCLDFLPIYHPRFEGLARLGHTAAGKTRAGTPDLLVTAGERQIAVQCGTERDYWPSEKGVAASKPYRDAMDCIKTLTHLAEIVLVTNRETPPNSPNVRAAISAAVNQQTTATVSLLGLEDLGHYLVGKIDEPRIVTLIAHYFPIVGRVLETQQEAAQHRVLQKIALRGWIDLGAALRVAEDAIRAKSGLEETVTYALEQAQALNACRLRQLPTFAGIVRASVATLPVSAPFGKVWALTGVPKAGKTSALRQLAASWDDEKVVWFECPIDTTDRCADEIGATILRLLLPDANAGPLLRSEARLEIALKHATTPTATVVVVDNADRLSDIGVTRLAMMLGTLRRRGGLTNIACIFVAASGLQRLRAAVDDILTTPAWSSDELRQLLLHAGVTVDRKLPERYVETLEVRSGGHPLVALALARRYPRLEDLVISSLQQVPGLADEALSREVQQLLYADLLTNADAQNFVQRAALFIERIPPDVMEALRTAVSPPIATATGVLLDQLSPMVIEGTAGDGYQVAFVFGEIAKQKVSVEEQQSVNEAAADVLLRPAGRTLYADRISWGIFHAILARQTERALMWTALLGRAAFEQHLPDDSISRILGHLNVVQFLQPPVDLAGQLAYAVAFMTLSQLHSRVGAYDAAADLSGRIRLDADTRDAPDIADEIPVFRLAVVLGHATYLLAAGKLGARAALATLGEAELNAPTPVRKDVILEIVAQVILQEGLEGLSEVVRGALTAVDPAIADVRDTGVRLSAAVGVKQALVEESTLPPCFPDSTFGRLLRSIAEGTFAMQRGDLSVARTRLTEAGELAKAAGWATGNAWADLQGYCADAAYLAGDDPAAISGYTEARGGSDPSSHMHAWSAWRLGLLRDDVAALTEAVAGFRELGATETWARALGARGALHLKAGGDTEGLRDLAEVLEAYYRDGKSAVGPAATVANSHLTRYRAAQAGSPKADDDPAFPAFGAEPYGSALSSWTPRAGPVVAFFVLGTTFRSKDDAAALRYFRQAADARPQSDADVEARPLAISMVIGLLGSAVEDEREIERRFADLLAESSITGKELAHAFVIFGSEHPNGAVTDPSRFARLLEALTRGVATATGRDFRFWEAELIAGRARLAEARGAKGEGVATLWNDALKTARPDINPRIMLRAGLAIGFEYYEHAGALRHLARCQFECLLGVELTGTVPTFLGNNLFQLWSRLRYRQLFTQDLETKVTLMDSAHEMKRAGVRSETAAPAMVLLLAQLFQHRGPATDWAEAELEARCQELPDDVRSRLMTR